MLFLFFIWERGRDVGQIWCEDVGQIYNVIIFPLTCGLNNFGWVWSLDLFTWACGVCQRVQELGKVDDALARLAESKALFQPFPSPY